MIRQIEEKVVNRLRQVTSAIQQDGANQVSIITSTAERQAAVEFAKAAAMRPQIVGAALTRIAEDPRGRRGDVRDPGEPEHPEGQAGLTLIPAKSDLLRELLATGGAQSEPSAGLLPRLLRSEPG